MFHETFFLLQWFKLHLHILENSVKNYRGAEKHT